MQSYALIATARFHGEAEQIRLEPGPPVRLDAGPPLPLPLPEGVDHLAQIEWIRRGEVRVTDALGRTYALRPDEALELELGELTVELELAPQFSFRRTEPVPWKLSIGWMVVVLLFTIFTSWTELIAERRCRIFAFTPELAIALGCVDHRADGGGAGDFTAEYLARLLKKDYAGEEDGFLYREERPSEGREKQDIFLPSGNRGPIEKMGGAEEVAPEAVKTPRSDDLPEPEGVRTPKKTEVIEMPTLPEGVSEVTVPAREPTEEEGDDEGTPESGESTPEERPAEEEEGWGLQDWYDEKDALLDELEIRHTIHLAQRKLRIDPNSPEALALLSYYQYLDEDYDAAEKTYDRYIELLPDDAAGYNNKALVYKRRGDYKTEESLYRVALSLEPLDVTAMNNLAVNLAHQHRFDEALAIMRQLEVLDPDDPYADLHRAKIYAEMGKDDEALRYLRKALEGMARLDTLHHIEFRQDIRLDPSFEKLRKTRAFRAILLEYYGDDAPVVE